LSGLSRSRRGAGEVPRGEFVAHPQADPMGEAPPVGQRDPTSGRRRSTKGRKPRRRACLRKGCGRRFLPRSWNHRFCSDPECAREVRRWRARKRQQRRRATAAGREAHRDAEERRRAAVRERRERAPSRRADDSTGSPRGHGATGGEICDRPGCFEPPANGVNRQARYCGAPCRTAVRRVRDRERKWMTRKTLWGIFKRSLEYARRRSQAGVAHP